MRFLSIGDPLVEFSARPDEPSVFDRRAGGDTLNTAIYLARLLGPGVVGYLSCLGKDMHSMWLRELIGAEGIDTSSIAESAGANPGLSFIATDPSGERSFSYWRDQSPFRSFFDDPTNLAPLAGAKTLFFSAVSLAVLRPDGRENLLVGLNQSRTDGARVVFDTNYRPLLWPDAETARETIARAAGVASLVMPSLDDMAACFGTAAPEDAMACLMEIGTAEILLTTGGEAVLHRPEGSSEFHRHDLPRRVAARDTTGAGDSFNAGWLAGREVGLGAADAIAAAARLAAIVVAHPGAIIPRSAMPVSPVEPKTTMSAQ